MNEKENSNMFKFSLFQGENLLCEKVFSADQFNPFTRYSINIKKNLKEAIKNLQKCLSKKNYETTFEVGRIDQSKFDSKNHVYELYRFYQSMVNKYPQRYRDNMTYNPEPTTQQIDGKTIKGVECEIRFFINDKPIVKRSFFVDNYNPIARWSVDLTNEVYMIADSIFTEIKNTDLRNMWNDYDLINKRGLNINQIREFSFQKREEMLRSIGCN